MIQNIRRFPGVRDAIAYSYRKWSEDGFSPGNEEEMTQFRGTFGFDGGWRVFTDQSDDGHYFWSDEHYIGSYSVNVELLEGNYLLITVTDRKDRDSNNAHMSERLGREMKRPRGEGWKGNTYHRWIWLEKVDPKEVRAATGQDYEVEGK